MNEQDLSSEEKVLAAIQPRLEEGRLPCAAAFAVAQEQGRPLREVVAVAGAAGIRVGWCQLGLFGGKEKVKPAPWPAKEIPAELRDALQAAAQEGHLACAQAWAIAHRLGRERSEVGRAANAMGIRIHKCQLGCF